MFFFVFFFQNMDDSLKTSSKTNFHILVLISMKIAYCPFDITLKDVFFFFLIFLFLLFFFFFFFCLAFYFK